MLQTAEVSVRKLRCPLQRRQAGQEGLLLAGEGRVVDIANRRVYGWRNPVM